MIMPLFTLQMKVLVTTCTSKCKSWLRLAFSHANFRQDLAYIIKHSQKQPGNVQKRSGNPKKLPGNSQIGRKIVKNSQEIVQKRAGGASKIAGK